VIGDETWVYFFEPESKRKSMEWHHTTSPRKKKFKTVRSAGKVMASVFWDDEGMIMVDFLEQGCTINSVRSAGKVMATVFWDDEGMIMVDFLEQGCTINSVQYVTTFKKLKARLH
jgi:Transposase.